MGIIHVVPPYFWGEPLTQNAQNPGYSLWCRKQYAYKKKKKSKISWNMTEGVWGNDDTDTVSVIIQEVVSFGSVVCGGIEEAIARGIDDGGGWGMKKEVFFSFRYRPQKITEIW
jgi:hypothetical protein